MKAWSASAVPGGPSTGNVVTQVSSDTESVGSSPSAKSRETSPTASPMMPARRLVPASSGDELENEPDPGQYKNHCDIVTSSIFNPLFSVVKYRSRC